MGDEITHNAESRDGKDERRDDGEENLDNKKLGDEMC